MSGGKDIAMVLDNVEAKMTILIAAKGSQMISLSALPHTQRLKTIFGHKARTGN